MQNLNLTLILSVSAMISALSQGAAGEHQEASPDIRVQTSNWVSDGRKIVKKKVYRGDRHILSVESVAAPGNDPKVSQFVVYGQNLLSISMNGGKMDHVLVEPSSYAISFSDSDKDGEWDTISILDDDLNLLEMFHRSSDGLLEPSPTKDIERLRKERREARENASGRKEEREKKTSP